MRSAVAFSAWRQLVRRRLDGSLFRWTQFWRGVYIEPGLSVVGPRNIELAPGVIIMGRAALSARPGSRLSIGSGSRIGCDVVISVAQQVVLGRNVLTAARCFISDHNHAFGNADIPIMHQGASTPKPVSIGDGTWLGINVCVLAGVSLGRNCVVAANSVVTRSFPDGSVIGGIPARPLGTSSGSS